MGFLGWCVVVLNLALVFGAPSALAAPPPTPERRVELAALLEKTMRGGGEPARCEATGKEKRMLRIHYDLCSERFMLKMENSGIYQTFRTGGFNKVQCTDDHGEVWTQEL